MPEKVAGSDATQGEASSNATPPERQPANNNSPAQDLSGQTMPIDKAAILDTVTQPIETVTPPHGPLAAAAQQPLDQTTGPIQAPITARRHRRFKRLLIILALLLVLLSGGGFYLGSYALGAYQAYNSLRAHAASGVQHLLKVKNLFTAQSSHQSGLLDTARLRQAQNELNAAYGDFQYVSYTLDHTSVIHTLTQFLPQYRPQVTAARALSKIGMEVSIVGQDLVIAALVIAPSFSGSLLSNSRSPLITSSTLDLIGATIDQVLPQLDDIRAQARLFSLNDVPQISASQRAQLQQVVEALPQAETDLRQAHSLLGATGWMLGVDQPRTFLVQTMDRAELRPTGGFEGQYGALRINSGRVGSFSLKDVAALEYSADSPSVGQTPPSPYSWWPIPNWGLRDANLSADFPTSAKMAMQIYKREAGQQVDGVITFTPFFIEHILQAIGPLQVPAYRETITAQNLEARLHYYQQDNAGIRRQEIVSHIQDPATARKQFTALLAQTLMNQIRHAPPSELLAIARQALYDLKTKDLQVYVTNPQIEGLLAQLGDAALLDRSTTHDGLFIVQANLSASKASQYVRTLLRDVVTIDAQGGATHVLQMRLVYSQIGPVYGLDTYRDYMRVYVPPTSKFLWGDGFDTGVPLCGGPLPNCPPSGVYPGGELLCPAGQYQAGASTTFIGDPYTGAYHPLDTVGPPTNFKSDEPARAMFAGWVVVPKNCTMNITLSWYVPPISHTGYSLLVQRQASTFPDLDLTIVPTPASCSSLNVQPQHFNGILAVDTLFLLQSLPPSMAANCYSQPGT